jgi:apolipoprotein N-acyltransferase
LPRAIDPTPYVRYGDIPLLVFFAASLAIIGRRRLIG